MGMVVVVILVVMMMVMILLSVVVIMVLTVVLMMVVMVIMVAMVPVNLIGIMTSKQSLKSPVPHCPLTLTSGGTLQLLCRPSTSR